MAREKVDFMELANFYNYNGKDMKQYLVTIQRQGNDRNGNPIYIVNIFDGTCLSVNYNYKTGHKMDKYGNLRVQSYNIDDSVQNMINQL